MDFKRTGYNTCVKPAGSRTTACVKGGEGGGEGEGEGGEEGGGLGFIGSVTGKKLDPSV